VFQFRRQLVSVFKSSKRTEESSASLLVQQLVPAEGPDGAVHGGVQRELPDVTGFLVVVLVTLGLFVVPVGATIMQGPAIVASIFGR